MPPTPGAVPRQGHAAVPLPRPHEGVPAGGRVHGGLAHVNGHGIGKFRLETRVHQFLVRTKVLKLAGALLMSMIMALVSLGTRDGFSNLTLTVVAGWHVAGDFRPLMY